MTTLFVDDFKLGLDTRRSILTAEPGSLRVLDNCIITQGGEIEKAASFVQVATLPAGSQGIHGTNTGADGTEEIYTWCLGASPGTNTTVATFTLTSTGVTVPVIQQQLQMTTGQTLARVSAADEYGPGNMFVVGNVNPGNVLTNWWEGNIVPGYTGAAPLISGQKAYRVQGPVLYFSGVGDPSAINPLNPGGTGPNTINPGAGFIDCSRIDSDANWLVGMEAYYKQVALFSRKVCLLFTLDPDLANNTFQQLLRIGAVSNGSIVQFGTGDVIFLADSGVRSLRVLNASLAAGVNDMGSPIDKIIQAAILANNSAALVSEAIIDPITGRYWLAIGNVIYILSYWPSAKISAWSTITLPFNVDHMTVAGTRIYVLSGNNLYLYAGLDGATYDTNVATVRTPHMSAETPTTEKKPDTINAMVTGNWSVSVGMTTDNTDYYELAANISGPTYSMQKIPFAGKGTHIGFTMTCTDAAPSNLGAISVSFQKTVEK